MHTHVLSNVRNGVRAFNQHSRSGRAGPCTTPPACPHQRRHTQSAKHVRAGSTSEAASSSAGESTAGSTAPNVVMGAPVSPRKEAMQTAEEYRVIYDRLIKVFRERPRDEWKKLIVMSQQWPKHAEGVLSRVKELIDQEEDVEKKLDSRRFYRSLQNVHLETKRYNTVLQKFLEAGEEEWEAVVAVYRPDLQRPFFEHTEALIAAAAADKARQEQLVAVNTKLLALVAAHDSVAKQGPALEAAGETMKELLQSAGSVEDMDKRLGELAAEGRIDPAFLHITAKAYGNAKDRTMNQDEVKDLMFRMYIQARNVYQQKQPREERILKYLLKIDDAKYRWEQLDAAVTPGPEVKGDESATHDIMWTTPQRLYRLANLVVQAFEKMRSKAKGQMRVKNFAMTPKKIKILKEIRDYLQAHYL